MKRSGGGVADYFAILGIGETLELKSTQKKYQRVSTLTNNETEKLQQREAILQEEECAMVERFYREIVEVCIFTAYSDGTNGDFVGGSLATSISASGDEDSCCEHQNGYYSDQESYDRDIRNNNENDLGHGAKRRYQISSIVPSPQKLSRKAMDSNKNSNEATATATSTPKQMLPKEISGFQIIYETISSKSRQTHTLGVNSNISGISQATDNDLSLINSSSLHQNSTLDSTTQQPLDADLNPATGLLSTVQSFDKLHQDLSFSNLSFDNNNIQQPEQKKKKEHWGRFKKSILSPLLATKTKATIGDSMGNKSGDSGLYKHFYIGFRRRGADETDKPAVADLLLMYCKVNKATIVESDICRNFEFSGGTNERLNLHNESDYKKEPNIAEGTKDPGSPPLGPKTTAVLKRGLLSGASLAKRVAVSGKNRLMRGRSKEEVVVEEDEVQEEEKSNFEDGIYRNDNFDDNQEKEEIILYMHEILDLPEGFDNGEWIIPCAYQSIKIPRPQKPHVASNISSSMKSEEQGKQLTQAQKDEILATKRMKKTFLFNHRSSPTCEEGAGVEAFVNTETFLKSNSKINGSPLDNRRNPWSPVSELPDDALLSDSNSEYQPDGDYLQSRESFMPSIISNEDMASALSDISHDDSFVYVPIVAVRRQRVGEEERFHEDPGMIDIAMTLSNLDGSYAVPDDDDYDEFDGNEDEEIDEILGKSKWSGSPMFDSLFQSKHADSEEETSLTDFPTLIFQHNLPNGFLDTPFATGVLDRFPRNNYVGAPLPEEELPMFCYPTGCRLHRARYQDAPLAEYYGFVVKNERGDNIHVSCVSFMEPLETSKLDQLDQMSEKKRKTSLAHRIYCEKKERAAYDGESHLNDDKSSFLLSFDEAYVGSGVNLKTDMVLTAFDELMTFELKTICLIGRYPFWSAFRRFLSHLHILSGSSSELPLERYISHLLLAIPIPKPGGQCTLIPLPAIASPMVLSVPSSKDLPLLDLPCQRLFSCLDAPTVVTIVLGFLALERKVIIMSTYPSLVSDVCEILRSLLFPFELCAPYVPRLTSPFMSCLQFPGAIFVGIHDDGNVDGLAASVRKEIPEDTFIVDLDTGDIDCNGDRYEVLKDSWDVIPSELRSLLVEELETLCQDAKLVPGQEPLGVEIEAALDVPGTQSFGVDDDEALDDRAIRDSFLRFFCSILGGYERFLVVPDMDFLISGNEWFDSSGFLNATKSQSRAAFLNAFTSTQLFQSFIQRRTEASDVRCLLFDECLVEFHSSKVPYGRLSRYGETSGYMRCNRHAYDLLVDQCAADGYEHLSDIDEVSSAEVSILTTHTMDGLMMINNSGDFVTAPSRKNLPIGTRYVYCSDGHPHFPQTLDPEMFYPKEPDHLPADIDEEPVPVLTRSDRENDVSKIRRKLAVTHRGVQRQRRCLFQLPKLMGSHFLNSWLMCVPSQVSQALRTPDQHKSYILRALGALRTLRSRHRIVPDEAGYRCLIVACGRADSDRRQELVKLFGLLRSDGIFPSAVTLGQYTRAIAEGFSKQSAGRANSIIVDHYDRGDEHNVVDILDTDHPFDFLDGNLIELEESGNRWRSTRDANTIDKLDVEKNNMTSIIDPETQNTQETSKKDNEKKTSRRRRRKSPWCPVQCSSSFSPHWRPNRAPDESFDLLNDFAFVAMWSRATTCPSCLHTLLDEEIQAGWDEISTENEHDNDVKCPCCGAMLQPKIGYCELTHEDLIQPLSLPQSPASRAGRTMSVSSKEALPPQLKRNTSSDEFDDEDNSVFYVPYMSPARMRQLLEEIVEEHGEDGLEREHLRYRSPEVFFNLWWYCARFSLPLPLALSPVYDNNDDEGRTITSGRHLCAFASWDMSLAFAGCRSGAKAVRSIQTLIRKSFRPRATPSFQKLVKSFDPSENNTYTGETSSPHSILSEDFPLLSYLNLQSLAQGDWDNTDLSTILVPLVEACDKRDFLPALKAVLQCNINRRSRYGMQKGVELECYQTLLYLTRYQCASAFHKFFPTTLRACKGYHFWCPHSTVTIFDRMFREASDRLRRTQGNHSPVYDVSDIALGFRSVFGHII